MFHVTLRSIIRAGCAACVLATGITPQAHAQAATANRPQPAAETGIYDGSFESSDPLLNRVWLAGATAARLCIKQHASPAESSSTPDSTFAVIQSMADGNHRPDALAFMREHWGSLLAATGYRQSCDPTWYKPPMFSPSAWLTRQVLGIQPGDPSFSTVDLRPDLAGLDFARGSESTPQGSLKLDARRDASGIRLLLDLPAGIHARLFVPGITVSDPHGVVPTQGVENDSAASSCSTTRATTSSSPAKKSSHPDLSAIL